MLIFGGFLGFLSYEPLASGFWMLFFSFDKTSHLNCAGGALRDCDGLSFLYADILWTEKIILFIEKMIFLDGGHIVYHQG